MTQSPTPKLQLLRWTKASSGDESGDPLGLELRVLTRLQSQLLHCITSVTPRARYYTFLPWCVSEYSSRERGASWAEGIESAVTFRERALALGCVALHKGDTCIGGGVVASDRAMDYLNEGGPQQVAVREFTKRSSTTAWNQYFGSLVNLGIFVETPTSSESAADEVSQSVTVESLTLSPIGQAMAEAYGQVVSSRAAMTEIANADRTTTLDHLADFAALGGVCEVMLPGAADREALRSLFFHKVKSPGRSHALRRQTLLLLMQLIGELGQQGIAFDERAFSAAVYFGQVRGNGDVVVTPVIPPVLNEIARRWRVFYIQFYFSLAFEALFRALVQAVGQAGPRGLSSEEFIESLSTAKVTAHLESLVERPLGQSLLDLTAAEVLERLGQCGCPPFGDAAQFERAAHAECLWSEPAISSHLRMWAFPLPADAFATGLLALIVSMARYRGETNTPFGWWLQSCVEDATRDLAAPSFDLWFESQGGDWMKRPLRAVLPIIVERFLIRLHEWLGYEKGNDNTRIIIHACEGRMFATGTFDKLGVSNTRLRNALRILSDLVLIERGADGVYDLTEDGRAWLSNELLLEGTA
jgi:hypothetical protein